MLADGQPEAGLGHLSRSSALAAALHELDVRTRNLAFGAQGPFARYGIEWEPAAVPVTESEEAHSAVVLDSYRVEPKDVAMAADGPPLVAFQDERGPTPDAALVVAASPLQGGPRLLGGIEYACLGPPYWNLGPRQLAATVTRVLVTAGGGEQASRHAAAMVGAVRTAVPEASITFAAGAHWQGGAPPGADVVRSPDSLFELLQACDLAVVSAGQSMLEAAATGTPTLVVVVADNQFEQADQLGRRGAVVVAGPGELEDRVRALAGDPEARAAAAAAARRTVDGRGAQRIAQRVRDLAAAASG